MKFLLDLDVPFQKRDGDLLRQRVQLGVVDGRGDAGALQQKNLDLRRKLGQFRFRNETENSGRFVKVGDEFGDNRSRRFLPELKTFEVGNVDLEMRVELFQSG